jgi:N-acylneuraminate cytidylyltransferase
MSAVAIITARGGSKRIPRKNIRPFLGRPIIAYSIEAALGSDLFDEVMVSTDDDEIAEIARDQGAAVPFLRSAQTSDDHSTTAEVLREVLGQYREHGRTFDYVCCIYPTAPFVTAEKLRQAFDKLVGSRAEIVLPVARFSFPIWRAFRMEGGRLSYIWPENAPKRSQDLPPAFQDAGQFYFLRPASLRGSRVLVTENNVGIEVDEREVQDIDNEQDWQLAELKYRLMLERRQA